MQATKPILLTHGRVAIVDADMYEELARHLWSARLSPNKAGCPRFYAQRSGWFPDPDNPLRMKMLTVGMHRQVLGYFGTLEVDHINGDSLDNRRDNLRVVTRSQNMMNRGMLPTNTSGFKGVYWVETSHRWLAKIKANGVTYRLGLFETPEEASAAYQAKAAELHGEYARAA